MPNAHQPIPGRSTVNLRRAAEWLLTSTVMLIQLLEVANSMLEWVSGDLCQAPTCVVARQRCIASL